MTSIDALMKLHDFGTFRDVTEHVLLSSSAEKGLISYPFFQKNLLHLHYISSHYHSILQLAHDTVQVAKYHGNVMQLNVM